MPEPMTFLQALNAGYDEVEDGEYLVRVARNGDFWYGYYSQKENGPKTRDVCLGPMVKP